MLDWDMEYGYAFWHSDIKRSHIFKIRYTFQLRCIWLLRVLHLHPKGNSGKKTQTAISLLRIYRGCKGHVLTH